MSKAEKRRKLLVEPQFQKPFILFNISSAIIVSFIYFVSLEFFYQSFQSQGTSMGLSADHIFFKFLDEQRFFLNTVFLVTTTVTCIVMMILGLYYSNRIAGPLHRLRTYLNSYRAGTETGPLTFRETDYFSLVAQELNQTLQEGRNPTKVRG